MGLRPSKAKAELTRQWKVFCNKNSDLINKTSLPSSYTKSIDMFQDFLMHGIIDHHHDDFKFSIDDLSKEQIVSLKTLIFKYFDAGFCDPGIVILTVEEQKELARKFPNRF